MDLPKPKTKKLIDKKRFDSLAEKVRKDLDREARYLYGKKIKYGDHIFSEPYSIPQT